MSVLLSIPTDVCHVILSDWLTMNEWSLLDVAISNRKLRVWLLEQFKLLSNTEMSYEYLWSVYYWINARNIKLKYLRISDSLFNDEGCLRVDWNLDSVIDIFVHDTIQREGVLKIVNQCKNLRQLSVDDFNFVCDIDSKILTELTSLCSNYVKDVDLSWICDYCTKLTTFQYTYDHNDCLDLVFEIIKNNPKLEHLAVCGGEQVISTIRQHCKSLKSVTINTVDVSLSVLNAFLSDYPSLELFEVNTPTRIIYYKKEKRYLQISGYNDDVDQLIRFICNFSDLKMIEFQFMFKLTDKVMDFLVSRNCKTLQSLKIMNKSQLSAACMRNVILRCSSLTELLLFCNEFICDGMTSIFCDDIPNQLIILKFGGDAMTTAAMIHVLKACLHLEYCSFTTFHWNYDDNDDNDLLMKECKELINTKVSISTGVKLICEIGTDKNDNDDDKDIEEEDNVSIDSYDDDMLNPD